MAEQEFRHIVRVASTDLNGNKHIGSALTKVKGISIMFATMVCRLSDVDKSKKAGVLTEEEVKKLDAVIENPAKFGAPSWMLNQRKDMSAGQDRHLIRGDLAFAQDNAIKMMRKIRTYRGVRHSMGLPVRGQRTRSNFRKNKGNVMGVQRKKVAAPAKSDDKKK